MAGSDDEYAVVEIESECECPRYAVVSAKWIVQKNDFDKDFFYCPATDDKIENRRCVEYHADIVFNEWAIVPMKRICTYTRTYFFLNSSFRKFHDC